MRHEILQQDYRCKVLIAKNQRRNLANTAKRTYDVGYHGMKCVDSPQAYQQSIIAIKPYQRLCSVQYSVCIDLNEHNLPRFESENPLSKESTMLLDKARCDW